MIKTIAVRNSNATLINNNGEPLTCGNSEHQIRFIFSTEWKKYAIKNAVFTFTRNGKKQSIIILFTGDFCNVPILSGIDEVYVGVFAGNLKTTTPVRIPCEKSALCDVAKLTDPPSDFYPQLLKILEDNYPVDAGVAATEAAAAATAQTENAIQQMEQFINEQDYKIAQKLATMNPTLLWQNENFNDTTDPSQTIEMDLSEYERFTVIYKCVETCNEETYSSKNIKYTAMGKSVVLFNDSLPPTINVTFTDSAITFSDASYRGNTGSYKYLTPLKILGYKY